MELELSLGDLPAPVKANITPAPALTRTCQEENQDLVLGLGVTATERANQGRQKTSMEGGEETVDGDDKEARPEPSVVCPLRRQASAQSEVCRRGFDVVDGRAWIARSLSPPSMHMEVPAVQGEASEDEENGGGRVRKKLRLSKEQSAFLEDSFKEHSALTLEQKSHLANRLSLRPRQVEVWFQNRRARTKLKQTEVDCEYLKRWCETLARENRKLQREVAELRAFRAPAYPLYNHHLQQSGLSTVLPVLACPSCDSKSSAPLSTVTAVPSPGPAVFPRPQFAPFTISHPVLRRRPSATS